MAASTSLRGDDTGSVDSSLRGSALAPAKEGKKEKKGKKEFNNETIKGKVGRKKTTESEERGDSRKKRGGRLWVSGGGGGV